MTETLPGSPYMTALFGTITAGLILAMAIGWVIQWRTANAGWVDVVWSFATGVGGAVAALVPLDETAPTARQWLVAAMAMGWAIRLGGHIAQRSAHGAEDVRYARFREEWGSGFQAKMFGFLMIQAAASALLVLSIMVAARNPLPGLGIQDLLGLAVFLAAMAGETIADRQLRAFRSDPANKGGICDAGLWGWSRHPNYFFEWLGWVGYAVIAIAPGYSAGWLALTGPAFMYLLLVHLSGIPPTEREMLRSRGERFRRYQARTSAFIPLPPQSR